MKLDLKFDYTIFNLQTDVHEIRSIISKNALQGYKMSATVY